MTTSLATTKRKKKINPRGLKLCLLAIPFVIFIFLFSYVPLMGWALAFFNYKPGLSFDKIEFVGLKYFALLFEYKDDVLNALVNTLAMSGLSFLVAPLPVLFAIMLTEIRSHKLSRVLQATVTLPNFVSWVIIFSLFFGIFSSDGLYNQVMMGLGWTKEPNTLLSNPNTAWALMISAGTWATLGWNSIVYSAAIAGIDQELYDAAKVDGAGRFRCIWHIMIPGVMPTFTVLLLLQVGNLLSVGFEQYFVFNNPMMSPKLEVLDMYIYRIGIGTQDYSFATAVGILKSAVSITLLFLVNSIAKCVRGESII